MRSTAAMRLRKGENRSFGQARIIGPALLTRYEGGRRAPRPAREDVRPEAEGRGCGPEGDYILLKLDHLGVDVVDHVGGRGAKRVGDQRDLRMPQRDVDLGRGRCLGPDGREIHIGEDVRPPAIVVVGDRGMLTAGGPVELSIAGKNTPFGEVTPSEWDAMMAINLRAPFFVAQAAAPHLRKARSHFRVRCDSTDPISQDAPVTFARQQLVKRGLRTGNDVARANG